jgi:molybdopterin-guanine dinucleotide biosynthesis protein A
MGIGAAILAGGRTGAELRQESGADETALIQLAGKPMAQFVVEALARTTAVDDIALVAPPGSQVAKREWPGARLAVSKGDRMMDSIVAGAEAFPDRALIVVAACDMPLVTPEALGHFCDAALAAGVDCCYSMVPKEVVEAKCPGSERTWVRLRDGVVTGGNITAVRPGFILEQREQIERAFSLRKRPLKLAQMFGLPLLLGLLFGWVTSEQVVRRAERILGCTAGVVKSPYAEIGIDVDKPSDLRLVRGVLEGR